MSDPSHAQAAKQERVDQLFSGFIRRQYRVSLRTLYSKMRAPLLDDVERVACNLCGADEPLLLAETDKYALRVSTVMCRKCGLMYLNPRPTEASYGRFYEDGSTDDGVYHVALGLDNFETVLRRHFGADFRMTEEDRAALLRYLRAKHAALVGAPPPDNLGETEIAAAIEVPARAFEAWEYEVYAADLFEYLKPHVKAGSKVFEAGASWGKLLEPWRDRHGCEVTGLEPRAATVKAAKALLGIDLFQGFPATAPVPENTYDVVMNIRTINHMTDPLGDLRHAWRWLKPNGILFIDISDAICETRYEGLESNVVEIDHAHMFSLATLSAMVEKAGFEVVQTDTVDTRHVFHREAEPQFKQIRIVGRKSEAPVDVHWPDPMQELSALLHAQLLRERELIRRVADARGRAKAIKAQGKRRKIRAQEKRKAAQVERWAAQAERLAMRAKRWTTREEPHVAKPQWLGLRGFARLLKSGFGKGA